MDSFGKKIADLRKARKMSQSQLAKLLNTSTSVIGRYERDEMLPSIEVAKKIAKILDTTVSYLIGGTNNENLLKDPMMLKRFNDINELSEDDRNCIYKFLDAFLANNKFQSILRT